MALLETYFDSQVLHLSLGMNIVLPEHPEAWKEPPAVLYLLHGLSNNHTSWIRRTSIERYAKEYNLAVVMPEVHRSFYCDMAHGSDYWKFISEELPSIIQRWFKLSDDPAKTFVSGQSMGGYGAAKLALGCPGQYAAAAPLSGALDIASHIYDDWDDTKRRTFESVFDDLETVPGSTNDLIAELDKLQTVPTTRFYVCCGRDDFLYQDSITFCDKAKARGIDITYEESEDDHVWSYWDIAIQRVLEWLPIEPLVSD